MKMKNSLMMITAAGLAGVSFAQEAAPAPAGVIEEEAVVFPADVAPTQLTPEQEKEAGELLNEARTIYAGILNDDAEGKADYLRSNLLFIEERIAKTSGELGKKQAELDALNEKVLNRRGQIDAMQVDEKVKANKRIQLVDEFRNEKEALTFRINMLKNHLAALGNRQSRMKADLGNLGQAARKAPTEAEKADRELERIKREEQLKRFEKYKK